MIDLLTTLGLNAENPGAWCGPTPCTAQTTKRLASINPTTGEVLGHVITGNEADYEAIMRGAMVAAEQWRVVPAPKRGELVRLMGERLRALKEPLGRLVALEMGKSLQEGYGEVQEMIDMADLAVGQSRMLYGVTMHSERPHHRMYEQWHPYGVVGVMTSFNFPVAVWAWNAFLAVVCGNAVVWKPSSKTPLCAVAVQQLCADLLKQAGYPDVLSLFVAETHTAAERLLTDPRLPLISFTGSTAVGRQVAVKVADRLGKSLLELGGNNAVIIDETADLALAIPAVVFGAIGTAGQRCTSTRRLFVAESIYEEVLARLLKAYQSIRIGDPLVPTNHMGPLIDEGAVAQYQQALGEVTHLGGQIVFGGRVLSQPGFFVEPTLVTGVRPDWEVVQKETFAPILYVMSYRVFDEAIQWQNAVPQGLSSALFTQHFSHAEQFLSVVGSDCGIANINVGTSGAEIGGAFGGEKETGGGREAGSDAWRAYMRRQTNTMNWGKVLPLAQGIQFEV